MASALRSRLRARLSGQALVLAGVLVVGVLFLVACGGGAQPAAAPAPAQATAAPVPPTEPPAPTATLAPSATPEPTATATAEPSPTAVVVADASNCVACHTSEETLQKLAKEEAPAEKLSEGEG